MKVPPVGKYIVGDLDDDGHTHDFYIGEHPLDVENPDENMQLTRGDFPKATTTHRNVFTGSHAHSIVVNDQTESGLECQDSNESRIPHIHTKITKVES